MENLGSEEIPSKLIKIIKTVCKDINWRETETFNWDSLSALLLVLLMDDIIKKRRNKSMNQKTLVDYGIYIQVYLQSLSISHDIYGKYWEWIAKFGRNVKLKEII